MKYIVPIYTGQGLAEPLQRLLTEQIPEVRLTNIIDDGIIGDVISNNGVSKSITRRLLSYYQIAADMGADLILNTCSSVGEVVELAQDIISVPILKIDQPMADYAVKNHASIGVIATLPTTLNPTMNLLQSQAKQINKSVSVVDGLAKGAYQALVAGDAKLHDQLIMDVGLKLANEVDCIVLAQASMMRMQAKLQEETGIPVLASPPLAIPEIKSILEV